MLIKTTTQLWFGSAGRRVTKITRDVPKDFTINNLVQEQYRQLKEEDLKLADVKLSEAHKRNSPKQIHFQKPDPIKLSAYIKEELKDSIDHSALDAIAKTKLELDDKTLKVQENRIMGEEAAKFKKIVFKQNECKRLLKNEENRPQNYLPLEYLEQNNETTLIELNKKKKSQSETLKQLNNQRISRMMAGKQPDPYEYLVKSQLLQQYPETRQLINQQMINMQQENDQQVVQFNNQMVDEFINQVKANVDMDKSVIDWTSLHQFYTMLLQTKSHNTNEFLEQQQNVSNVQTYSNNLFDQFYNQQLSLRIQGQIQFSDLTDEESVRYIKYDITPGYPELTLRLITTYDSMPTKFSGPIMTAILAKATTFHYTNKLSYLEIYKDPRFHTLLNYIARTQFDDQNLAQTILGLSLLRPKIIVDLYDKLSFHLYNNLTTQLVERLDKLPTPYLAMTVRNIHMLPMSKSIALQNMITDEIVHRSTEELSVYEAESFLGYLYRIDHPITMSIASKLFSAPKSEIEMDSTTLATLSRALIKQIPTNSQAVLELINTHKDLLEVPISESQVLHLAPFAVMLSQINIPRTHDLVRFCKKRLVQIMALRKNMQDETDLVNVVAAMSKIDSRGMYEMAQPNEVLILQSIFNRQPFPFKSNYYIPYSNTFEIVQRYQHQFTEKNLIILLQSMSCINYTQKGMIGILQGIKDAQYAFPIYLRFRIIDQLFDELEDKFQKLETITPLGAVYYLQALFHLKKITADSLQVLTRNGIMQELNKLDITSKCYLIMILSTLKGTQDIINQLLLITEPQTIEQQYLILLSKTEYQIDKLRLIQLWKQQQEISDSTNNQLGVEGYKTEEIRQLVCDELKTLGITPERDVPLQYCQVHFYIEAKQLGIHMLSVNDLIKDKQLYKLTGFQRHLQRLQNIKYIIYEEFVRSESKQADLMRLIGV